MNTKILTLVIIFLILLINVESFSQDYNGLYPNGSYDCGTIPSGNEPLLPEEFRGGVYKVHRSDIGGAPTGIDYFPILVVFVQFDNEPSIPPGSYGWHAGVEPDYMDSMITYFRAPDNNDWWNSYNGYQISDYWHEFSRGRLHAIGQAIPVTLPHDYDWYKDPYNPNGGRAGALRDTYEALIALGPQIDWPFYDRWKYNSGGNFAWERDGRVDMIYITFRHDPNYLISSSVGYMPQGNAHGQDPNGNYQVYQSGSYTISITHDGWNYGLSSGAVVNGRTGYASRELFLDVMVHEHGHYLFGEGHDTYGKMAFGPGWEFSLSPWEMVRMDYITPKYVHYENPYHVLNDYSSRYGSAGDEGEILEVPINESGTEFFLVANRRKVSEWDRRMGGDTIPGAFLKNINPEYGKGVYIYHISCGYNYGFLSHMDMECADGIWDWIPAGQCSPDWSQSVIHPTYKRESISTLNDNSYRGSGLINRDGISFYYIYQTYPVRSIGAWYSIGKPHTYSPKTHGTDRIYTNEREFWYSLETAGDRWDAWNVGYNEVFSPYSNPNTKDWQDVHSNIYIWYKDFNPGGNQALLEIYRVGENDETELTILEKTPPSRPMELVIEEYYPGSCCHPELQWEHNMEPDMERPGGVKRYKIYRSEAPNMNSVPPDAMANPENVYTEIDEVDINYIGVDYATYVDFSVNLYDCSLCDQPPHGTPYPVRYRVQAVDEDDMTSVLSDFASEVGTKENGGHQQGEGENPIFSNNEIPDVYALRQNFPNPFNPATNIQFDLPNDVNVTIKVYDITGKEVAVLVNEFKKAGSYIVSFNGSKLSSGVYFYKIEAGSFSDIKRMVLVK